MPLTSEAKRRLAETVRGTAQDPSRGLRAKLLVAIHDEADRRYRLSVSIAEAGLDEAHRRRRERLEGWIEERTRAAKPKNRSDEKALRARFLRQAEKEAAATLINRLVLLRQLEAYGLSKPAVLTGGWSSRGYREFHEFGRTLCVNGTSDPTEGYETLLQLVFDELAVDLPGLFGDVGMTRLLPVPAATLREVVEALDDPELTSAWTDDTTLGWVYQYWNDPDREALDAKIAGGGKIEPHEIASKTQMFTERYIVEWLVQNSLGMTWLCMCQKQGWRADAEAVLPVLDARRADWRARREAGAVALDALMPIEGELEEHWKYYVLQPLPEDAIAKAPERVRDLKVLDPAVGSGHFLVIAFGLLAALYREESRHRGETISDREIAESIVENNLHGIDIDPRAIQIAAASIYLRMKRLARDASPRRMNLVAPVLELGKLPHDDPAVVALRADLKREVGIPEELTDKLLGALAGVDHLGSLLKVDAAVEQAIAAVELEFEQMQGQGNLWEGFPTRHVKLSPGEAKATILEKIELFLARHSTSEDLGLRLDGEQLASGIRFVRLVREGTYDVVVGNPPYQGLSRASSFGYVAKTFPKGKADLYSAFLVRGLELVREGGISALLTMRSWMFQQQFRDLRKSLLHDDELCALVDLDSGAFEDVSAAQVVLSVSCSIFRRGKGIATSKAFRPTSKDDRASGGMTGRKRAGLLAQFGQHNFNPRAFVVIDGEPILYWWDDEQIKVFNDYPLLGSRMFVASGVKTGNDVRFLRSWFEVDHLALPENREIDRGCPWQFYIKGAAGAEWVEPAKQIVSWRRNALEIRVFGAYTASGTVRLRDPALYFRIGIAFSPIGASFSARVHRKPSIFGNMGSSVFTSDLADAVCLMNSTRARQIIQALNPTIHFENEDVERLPLFPVSDASSIWSRVEEDFSIHEKARETSAEFLHPGPSPWRYAQNWAQWAVDRPSGHPLPAYTSDLDVPESAAFVSFSVGVALGRFGANGEGIRSALSASALPGGVVFISAEGSDSLAHSASQCILEAWRGHGDAVGEGDDLQTYLRTGFFAYHKRLYESRPIYFPLSSAKKSFVAFVSIHRWQDDTLNILLADHLTPARRRFEGELDDLRTARTAGSNRRQAERRFTEVQRLLEELVDFIAKVTEIAEQGAPPPDAATPKREVDARYAMDLDDGVMVNSAALWPLLEPQWKEPKKWWKELASAHGKKDYDWSHLAARYFPSRVQAKCHEDPSLAVAHKCFWALHPAKAYAWELRLQDEIRPDFTIDEPDSDAARALFLADHAREAAEIRANEDKRRVRKAAKADKSEKEAEDDSLFASDDDSEPDARGEVDA
jgi:hypothetical protein